MKQGLADEKPEGNRRDFVVDKMIDEIEAVVLDLVVVDFGHPLPVDRTRQLPEQTGWVVAIRKLKLDLVLDAHGDDCGA